MVAFGICPNKDCKLSYRCADELERWYVTWKSERFLLIGGSAGTARREIPYHLSRILQVGGRYCTDCGVEVAHSAELPNLGKGSGETCGRSYTEQDFGRTFCPRCGTPIDIPADTREQYSRHVQIRRVLKLIPRLQEDGLLPM
jgi:hypothetical protein